MQAVQLGQLFIVNEVGSLPAVSSAAQMPAFRVTQVPRRSLVMVLGPPLRDCSRQA